SGHVSRPQPAISENHVMKSLSPLTLAFGFALASLHVAGAIPSAEAASRPSPFEGSFLGAGPSWGVTMEITITTKSAKTAYLWGYWTSPGGDLRLSGTGDRDGRMSCTLVSRTADEGGIDSSTSTFTAVVSVDASGNIVGTTHAGTAFIWYRR